MNIDLANMPESIAALSRDSRGYPVPWFCTTNPDGSPNFQTASGEKRDQAVKDRLCWVCGQKLGRYLAFVVGPMCTVNRVSGEPPEHRGCAEFSLRTCPFLLHPEMKRMPAKYQEGSENPGGIMIERNPGVAALWITHDYRIVPDRMGSYVLHLGEPVEVTWWAEGRPANRLEVCQSIATGLPILIEIAKQDGAASLEALEKAYNQALNLLPAEEPTSDGH